MTDGQTSKLRRDAMQWFILFIGPVAFALDETIAYALTYKACSTGRPYLLYLVSLGGLALTMTGIFMARFVLRNVSPHAEERGGTSDDRTYFMARLGLFTSIAFALVIIALAIPRFILSPCE